MEYKKESFALFESMNFQVASESVEKLFKIQLQMDDSQEDFRMPQQYSEEDLDYDRPQVKIKLPSPEKGENRSHTQNSPPQLNRAQRRRQKQQLKKKKIKV